LQGTLNFVAYKDANYVVDLKQKNSQSGFLMEGQSDGVQEAEYEC
jgi:hypothetical protein